MPLQTDTLAIISQWFMQHTPASHMVNRDADSLHDQRDAACFRWAIQGLVRGGTTPDQVLDDIVMGGATPGFGRIAEEIHATFGYCGPRMNQYLVGPLGPGTRELRNAQRADLHRLTAEIFDRCLLSNGFQIVDRSNYLVCMEYDCAPGQAMYPNFTHAWLAYRNSFVIQTIPGSDIEITMLEAGRAPHCGLIRRPVSDFLPEQLDVIEALAANPAERVRSRLAVCFPMGNSRDVLTPRE